MIFHKGLNVISGASDTGKTYVYECIDYLLGGRDEPKEIPEAGDFKTFYLECQSYSGKAFTIERTLGEKSVIITKGGIEEARTPSSDGKDLMGISKTQSKSNNESLPNYLLEISGFSSNSVISRNARNEKKEISFRDIAPLIMIDEERIISKAAPFVSAQVVNKTKDKGVFEYVVSGSDDSELEEVEDPEIRRNKLKAQLEYIENLVKGLNVKIGTLQEEQYDIPKGTKGYDFLFGNVSAIENEIKDLSSERASSIKEKERLSLEIAIKRQLMQRFSLLKEHYASDLVRLEFITSGGKDLTEIDEADCECVLCGAKLSATDRVIDEVFMQALDSERQKISLSLQDLVLSIADVEDSIKAMTREHSEQEELISKVGNKIDKELLPLKESLSDKLKILIQNEQKESKLKELRSQIYDRTRERDSIKIDLSFVDSGPSKGSVPKKEIEALECFVQDLLKRWMFINNELVSIEIDDFDTEIDGKRRKLFGKGKRSLITAANVISLMLYCSNRELPHPGFVLIDTPLTPYKDSDSSEEKLTDKVQNAFYIDLAIGITDMQVIIIENKEPPESIEKVINHIHFTGNPKIGRKAFIPT